MYTLQWLDVAGSIFTLNVYECNFVFLFFIYINTRNINNSTTRMYICEITLLLLGLIKNSQRRNIFTSIFTEECVGAGSESDEHV